MKKKISSIKIQKKNTNGVASTCLYECLQIIYLNCFFDFHLRHLFTVCLLFYDGLLFEGIDVPYPNTGPEFKLDLEVP